MKLVWIILITIVIIIVMKTKEDPLMKIVRSKYKTFIDKNGIKPVLLSGFYGKRGDDVGYNLNKGAEIGICIDGTSNDMMHVLLHELAHTNTPEYDHNEKFWRNYEKLKTQAIASGVYNRINNPKSFCGSEISD
jgi:hypothetical protein